MAVTKKRLETLGGISSILAAFMCIGIGLMDYQTGQSWKIWAIMMLVLSANGVAMIRHAMKRPADEVISLPGHHVLKVNSQG